MKIVILGGVAAGAKAAAKSRRLLPDAKIDLYTDDTHISYSACGLPYFIEGNFEDYKQLLVRSPEEFEKTNVHIHLKSRAVKIIPESKKVLIQDLESQNAYLVEYDKLIIAIGASPIIPKIKNVNLPNIFTLRKLEDGIAIKDKVLNSKHGTIIGGGYIGIELLEALVKQNLKVTLIEYSPNIMPMFDEDIAIQILKQINSINNNRFEILTSELVTEFSGDINGVKSVRTGTGKEFNTDFVILCTGVKPNVEIAKTELHDIKENLKVKQAGWALFKANKNVRRAVFLGVLLQFMQQLTGFNIIMYYSPKILSIAGFSSTEEQMIGTVVNGLVFVLATFIAVGTVDKSGRKPALKRCFAIMAVSLFILGICFFGLESGSTASWIPYLSAGMVLLAIIGFGFGAGPVVWILCSEIQPLKSRDFGIACSTMTNWLSCTLIGATFLTLLDTLGSTMTFWLYAALNALFVYLTMRYVPETKGVTLEKIEQNLMEGKKLKDIGC